jgi:hypothetical protein
MQSSTATDLEKPSGGPGHYEEEPESYDTGQDARVTRNFEMVVSDDAQTAWCGLAEFRRQLVSESVSKTSLANCFRL